VSGTGKIEHSTEGKWEIIKDRPVNDMVIIASRDLKSKIYVDDPYQVRVDYVLAKEEMVNQLAEDAKFILDLYNNWFHASNEQQYTIVIVPPFPGRGSYFREGFIALLQPSPGMESGLSTFELLAHEFAHGWWSHANTNNWEDWLNESFAEYACLMAIREKYGNEIFNDWIDYKTFTSKYSGPVIRYGDHERTSVSTRYDKGPDALYHLETRLGKEDFIAVLKTINERNISTTDELLEELEDLTSQKVRKEFELQLMK
jgi:hypothetical protein